MQEKPGSGSATKMIIDRKADVIFWRCLAEWLGRLTANAVVATVRGSKPASSDAVESDGRQMKQC